MNNYHNGDLYPSRGLVVCRICGSDAAPQPWNGCVCASCGSVSVTVLPSIEELERYYLAFNQAYHGGGRAKGAKARQLRYAHAYLRPILSLNTGRRLLDIGSSTNPFPNLATANGFDVTVLDYVRPHNLDDRVKFVQGSIEDVRVIDNIGIEQHDIVTAFQVMEHCRCPRLMAEQMVRLCRHGGCVVIATPLVNSFSERYALGKSPWFYPPEHIHLISSEAMINLFSSLGCSLISAKRYELNLIRWLARYGLSYYEGFFYIIYLEKSGHMPEPIKPQKSRN